MQFKVTKQKLERVDGEKTIAHTTNTMAYFEFCEDWSNLGKIAYFYNQNTKKGIHMILFRNQCRVPWEILTEGHFTVVVFGSRTKAPEKRITTNTVKIRVFAHGYNRMTPC